MSDAASLPKATASGPAAATPDAVRPVRVAVGAGVLAALYLLVLYLVEPVPTRMLAMFGGAHNDVERYGGLEMTWRPPAGMADEEVLSRFHVGEHAAQVRRDHERFVIDVPRVAREQVEQTAKRLGGAEGLEFHRVLRVPEMQRLITLLQLPMRERWPVDADVDQWRPDSGMDTKTDYYLIGTSVEAIEAKLREAYEQGWRLPPGARFAVERIESERSGVLFRTYVIDERAELDGGDIANATSTYDPNTNRPIVLLDFNAEGGEKFAKLTGEIVGEKLATMIGGQVYSAPIINGQIRGGRASITMGAGDASKQERERDLLINTLKTGALPRGGEIVESRYVEPMHDGTAQWLARSAIALFGGALLALLVWIVVRIARPVRRHAPPRTGLRLPASRVVVTLLAPVAIYLVTTIYALGINAEEIGFIVTKGGGSWREHKGMESFSFGALGIMPVINAFIFVEILSLIVPSWRRRRHAGPDARAPITTAVVITAITLLLIQSWFITQYMYGLSVAGVEVLEPGSDQWLVMLSFAIGTLVLVGVAALIRDYGLGNGYGVLLASAFLLDVTGRGFDLAGTGDADLMVGVMTMLAIGIPIATVARWRIARLGEAPMRLPTSGIAPLGEVGGLVALVALIATFSTGDFAFRLQLWAHAAREHHLILIAVVAGLTLLWSFAFAHPSVTRKLAERIGLVAPARESFWSATALSAALLVIVGAASAITQVVHPTASWLADGITIAIVTMVLLDIYDDVRARRVTLDRVWTLHQAQYIDLVGRAFDDAAIPHHFSSANLRTLLAFFGPFAPVDVLVPPEHAPAARQRLRELFE